MYRTKHESKVFRWRILSSRRFISHRKSLNQTINLSREKAEVSEWQPSAMNVLYHDIILHRGLIKRDAIAAP